MAQGKAHHRQQQDTAPEIGVAKLPPELLEKGGRPLPLGRPGHPGQGDHPDGQKQPVDEAHPAEKSQDIENQPYGA